MGRLQCSPGLSPAASGLEFEGEAVLVWRVECGGYIDWYEGGVKHFEEGLTLTVLKVDDCHQ